MTKKDVQELANYWFETAHKDWEMALHLFKTKKYVYCLFFIHLYLEKFLKGLVAFDLKEHPPYTHNLTYLAGKLKVQLVKEEINLLEEVNKFNIDSRYPDYKLEIYKTANKKNTQLYLKEAERISKWLKKQYSIK